MQALKITICTLSQSTDKNLKSKDLGFARPSRRRQHVDDKVQPSSYSHNVRLTTDAELCLSHDSNSTHEESAQQYKSISSYPFGFFHHVS